MKNIIKNPARSQWGELCTRAVIQADVIEEQVQAILDKVAKEGDAALKFFNEKFDQSKVDALAVSPEEIAQASTALSEELKQAIRQAYHNIKVFHEAQKEPLKKIETIEGVTCWRKSVPIDKVGLYIPGGTAPLFSTVLMLGAPAQIAGCPQAILCSPPNAEGKIHPAILFAADLVGIRQIYKVGGAQAIAAMGYGTETIAQTYKIFGPGNQYVTTAKTLLAKSGMAIDMPAGPSELAVIADDACVPAFVAADLLSQAEHGADSQVVLIATNSQVAEKVMKEVEKQVATLPRRDIAEKALKNSKAIVFDQLAEAIAFSNFYAPEHLIIATQDFEQVAEQVTNAGSVFLGNFTPESAGDYASGTNHTLPTNSFARAFSGVSLDSFYKKITFQHLTKPGLQSIAQTIETMATAESLTAHQRAVSIRFE
ncbi:histidinol dehydrogenase [Microscilla marina]|uniref:Histidinol dehydrogenase n=1 Tax=Microscilla marina ATCC 23134 TaxID=313606 RepID=A1ZNG6_MICM2|nr:histidinol dehydrogenase [Microscilla marina]EAY28077.1 histidinol dehydrogenase [Microscilla marina ATCC 23134]